MRKYLYLAYDSICICVALVAALYLRHGFPLIQEGNPDDIYTLLLATCIGTVCVLPLMRLHTGMWRFTSTSELADILIAVALVVVLANAGLFLINRLDMMPRSVPPLHWGLAVLAMGGTRLLARQLFGPSRQGSASKTSHQQHVIVVGAGHTAELYLQFIKRISRQPIRVAGLVDNNESLTGRMFQKHTILGTTSDIPRLMEEFHVHGIQIQQIVLAQLMDDLSESDTTLLHELGRSGVVEVVHFAKHMGPQLQPESIKTIADYYQEIGAIPTHSFEKPKGFYPYLKRSFDVVMGIALLLLLMPLIVLTSVCVLLDVGIPILFWQQRPGLHGIAFKLYKFRTMRHARRKLGEDRLLHKSGDEMRTSRLGKLLRRIRLDELPQLMHIIAGTMSFVGPRPLLPDDQPAGGEIRLSVRPGVTGWAQIHGGDALSPQEKLILDAWYIRNMSLWLDMKILLRTLLAVLEEDRRKTPILNKGTTAHEPI
ncbi:MAG: sugar transferase [Rickettsiales bacterium]